MSCDVFELFIGIVGLVVEAAVHAPGLENGFGEFQAGVTGQGGLIEVAAVSDDCEEWSLVVEEGISERVARFEQASNRIQRRIGSLHKTLRFERSMHDINVRTLLRDLGVLKQLELVLRVTYTFRSPNLLFNIAHQVVDNERTGDEVENVTYDHSMT